MFHYGEWLCLHIRNSAAGLRNKAALLKPMRVAAGHVTVVYKGRKAQLPAHGAGKDLKKGLVEAIKKQLGLK